MKSKLTLVYILLFLSFFMMGCANNEVEEDKVKKDDGYTEVRNVVIDFIEEQGWQYSIKDWEHARVEKLTVDAGNKFVDESYVGKEIYGVHMEDALASPTIHVDPETLEVIGYVPGE